MSNYTPTFKPTNKRRSFRPASFRPLDASTQPPSLATLSENLRASLMNVGMRVRKSVPEGYKTVHSKPGFSIYEQTAASHPELAPYAGGPGPSRKILLPPVELKSSPIRSQSVMTDEQVAATVDDVLLGLDADLAGHEDGSDLPGSQESGTSTWSNASEPQDPTRRKRSLVREEDEIDDAECDFGFGGVPMERDAPLRQIAQPRSRRTLASRMSGGGGKGKTVRFAEYSADDDFGEADFLMPDSTR